MPSNAAKPQLEAPQSYVWSRRTQYRSFVPRSRSDRKLGSETCRHALSSDLPAHRYAAEPSVDLKDADCKHGVFPVLVVVLWEDRLASSAGFPNSYLFRYRLAAPVHEEPLCAGELRHQYHHRCCSRRDFLRLHGLYCIHHHHHPPRCWGYQTDLLLLILGSPKGHHCRSKELHCRLCYSVRRRGGYR